MHPPKNAIRFLRWFCREDYIDEIEGDLTEVFIKQSESSPRSAKARFYWSVLRYFRPEFIKSFRNSQPNSVDMYSSYFKIGLRNLLRNKGYSLINIGGLAIGMMVAILNGLWIWHEFSYNKYFENYDRIAHVAEKGIDFDNGGTFMGTTMTYPLATALIENHADQYKRLFRSSFQQEKFLGNGTTKITVIGLSVDPIAPEVLSLKMLKGSRNGLKDMHSILISGYVATALFGDQDPVGKTIQFNNKVDVTITGVYEDLPQNTDFNEVRYFIPFSLWVSQNKWIEERAINDLRNHFIKVYMEINEGTTFEGVTQQIKPALKFAPEDIETKTKEQVELALYPMSDWHLHPSWSNEGEMEPLMMIKLVGAIGVFVLALACINFVNLSTARAEKRSKEVGIRKTIGSVRSQLINQFFSESFLVVLFSFFLAILLTALVLPGFNMMASKNITMPWSNYWFWLSGLAFILFTSVLAGFYPALYLSSFNPVKALKGTFRIGRMASLPRKILVVFQFSISVVLIVGTVLVYQQIQFAKNRPVGYDRDGLVMMRKTSDDFKGKYETLRTELKNTGVVYEVSESMGPVTDIYSGNNGWDWEGKDPQWDESFATLAVSHLHGKTIGWQFVKGRDFDMSIASDSSGIIITESTLKIMALADPIGQPVSWAWWADKSRVMNYKILGVIKDMVMDSPYAPAEPTIYYLKGHNGTPSWINIKISPQISASEALPKIERAFSKVIPGVPFDYLFADEEYAQKFGKEERIGNLASVFAGLAVLISCLGLLGLASFVAETRTKEVSIRKVLGASVAGLWRMLSSDFIWLVLIACVVSAPLSYYLMSNWLEKFAYHTEISMWVFVATGIGAIAITLITVSYQAIKAAMANPVNSLKAE
jgi:putative ABC transport system permease protein